MKKNLITFLATLIIPTLFLLYGLLAKNGIEFSKRVQADDATMYIYLAVFGYLLAMVGFIGQIIIDNKKNNEIKKTVEINQEFNNQQKESNNYIKTWALPCKLAFIIWIVYTVAWVMKLPYSYDSVFVLLGVIVGICWWRSKKANEKKDIEISEDK